MSLSAGSTRMADAAKKEGRQEVRMWRWGVALILFLFGAMPTRAADLPTRKAGLWEFKVSMPPDSPRFFTFRQCIDAATDQMMMSSAGPLPSEVCPRRNVHRSGDAITIDSTCTLKDKTATSHVVITGNMDSVYTMTMTAEGAAMPDGRMNIVTAAQWISPCTADQKPGDMMMGKGLDFTAIAMSGAMPMLADGLPVHKVGLWERIIDDPNHAPPPAQACIDAATDRRVRALTDPDPWSRLVCPSRNVQKTGNTVMIDATCKEMPYHPESGGIMPSVNVHAVVSGSFDSAYTMTVTTRNDAGAGASETKSITARWLGPCPARWVPGIIDIDGLVLGRRFDIWPQCENLGRTVPCDGLGEALSESPLYIVDPTNNNILHDEMKLYIRLRRHLWLPRIGCLLTDAL